MTRTGTASWLLALALLFLFVVIPWTNNDVFDVSAYGPIEFLLYLPIVSIAMILVYGLMIMSFWIWPSPWTVFLSLTGAYLWLCASRNWEVIANLN